MSRNLLFVLLLATGVALADDKPEAKHATGAAAAQKKTAAVPGQIEESQSKIKSAQVHTEDAHAETEERQGRSETAETQDRSDAAQVQTEAVRGQTEEAQAETPEVQRRTEAAEVKTEAGPERTPETQANIEEAQGQAGAAQAQADKDGKLISVPGGKALGMSVLGNQEAPTSLVIVPWKSSEVGRSLGISPMLDDSRQPVDKEVFMRELRYYEIRSEKKP